MINFHCTVLAKELDCPSISGFNSNIHLRYAVLEHFKQHVCIIFTQRPDIRKAFLMSADFEIYSSNLGC